MEKKQILVADDDQVARMLILKVLQMRDYEAVAVEDGKTALEALQSAKWDLLVLDLNLKGIKGFDLIDQARKLFPRLKVIILTGHGSLETAIEAIHKKVCDYMLKPALPKDILKSVDTAFRECEVPVKLPAQQANTFIPSVQNIPIMINKIYIYDSSKRRIRKNDLTVNLTQTENTIFAYLAEYQNKVVSHQELVNYTYGFKISNLEAAKMLRPVICRIRRKFQALNCESEIIQNVRGKGYLVESDLE